MENAEEVRKTVRERYGSVAEEESSCCGSGVDAPADGPLTKVQAERLGYSKEQTESVPDGANLGLGCGNPSAIAALQPGEVVLDLGSGAGFDA
ncbi:MAG: arsenite methyltransferase, partial [Persicimonas sp.]